MKRLGLLGTFVWDRIWTLADVEAGRAFETWGGMAYSLSAAAAARPDGWEVVPVAKVGADLADAARAYAAALPGVAPGEEMVSVPVENNRVELRYFSADRRGERLTGGVPAWTWEELAPAVAGLDALCVNFFSGFEMELEAAERLRAEFAGPLYADLHSLFLGCPGAGTRTYRPLPDADRWIACWDAVQLNEDELRTLDPGEGGDGRAGAARVVSRGPGLAAVTLGPEGAAVAMRGGVPADTARWAAWGRGAAEARSAAEVTVEVHPSVGRAAGDPTGCGDVWGATFFCALVGGAPVPEAARRAHAAAVRKLGHRGATGLYAHLAGGAG